MKKAFTIAEVLLSITIVGIIASYIIPPLAQNIQDAHFKAKWRKTFSVFNAATNLIILNNAGSFKGVNGLNVRTLRDVIKPYFNYIKICGYGNTLGGCWHADGILDLKGEVYHGTDQNEAGLILIDGTLINFGVNSYANCTRIIGSLNVCNSIYVDVNGFSGPNTLGKDIFAFHILENRILPFGGQGDRNENKPSCSCPDNGVFGPFCYAGAGCSAKYLMQ